MVDIHLFPFERIEKNSDIIIYGAGNVGQEYVAQILKTQYCNIVCVVDKNFENYKELLFEVSSPNVIKNKTAYDYILIAMDSNLYIHEVKKFLQEIGVSEKKILYYSDRNLNVGQNIFSAKEVITDNNNSVFRIGVNERGGIGDAIMTSLLLKEIRMSSESPCVIDFFCRGKELLKNLPFVDNIFYCNELDEERASQYDVFLSMYRFAIVDRINKEKTYAFSKRFYQFCMDSINLVDNVFDSQLNGSLITQYALLKGKNRIEQCDVNGIMNVNRKSSTYLEWEDTGFTLLYKLNLVNKNYITISRGTDSNNTNTHPKLWPLEYYNTLVKMIKEYYPDLFIVQVGENKEFGLIKNIDINLVGKTNLNEVKVIMKHGLFHIDGEGGLVHINHFLNGKSIVIFGPTSPKVFGYDENINLRSEICKDACEWVTNHWTEKCVLGYEIPLCMQEITPQVVFSAVHKLFDSMEPKRECIVDKIYSINQKQEMEDCFLTEIGKDFYLHSNVALVKKSNHALVINNLDNMDSLTIYDRNIRYEELLEKNSIHGDEILNKKIKYEYGFIYNIPAQDDIYDIVINFTYANESFPQFALLEWYRITKPSGRIIIYIEDYYSDMKRYEEYFLLLKIKTPKLISHNNGGALIILIKD